MAKKTRDQKRRINVAIVGDGQMERIYFADIKDTDRPDNLTIFPDYPKKVGSYKGVLDRAITLTGDYSKVFALVDLDKVNQDRQHEAYARHKLRAERAGVIVLENNPCFEIWLLLHFVNTARLFNSCDEVSELLRRDDRIQNYNKSEKFLVSARLYRNFKTRLRESAMHHASLLEVNRAAHDNLYPRAQTFKFFDWYFGQTQQAAALNSA